MDLAESSLMLPNWAVQTMFLLESYLRTKTSVPPAAVWPGRAPAT